MENLSFIRWHFQPLQPGAGRAEGAGLHYREFLPGAALQPYVACFWELQSDHSLDFPYHIIADGAVDLIFNLQNPETYWSVTNSQSFDIQMNGKAHYFGVRFLPACVHYFFELSLKDLTGQTIFANDLIGNQLAEISSKLLETKTILQKQALLEQALIQRFTQRNYHLDARLLQSLHHIFQSAGNAAIQKEVADWIGPRQLRRWFEQYLGLNPKTFARIVRFQQTLAAMQRTPQKYWGRIFYDYGYFDQAHFIREFKIFYGDSPKTLRFPTQ